MAGAAGPPDGRLDGAGGVLRGQSAGGVGGGAMAEGRRAPRAGPAWLREDGAAGGGGAGAGAGGPGGSPAAAVERRAAGGARGGGWELVGVAGPPRTAGLRTPRGGGYETPRFLKAVPFAGTGRKTWGNILQDLDDTTALLTKRSSEKETARNLATPSPQVKAELSFSLDGAKAEATQHRPLLTYSLAPTPAPLDASPIVPTGQGLPALQQSQPRFPGMGYPMEPLGPMAAASASADRIVSAPPCSSTSSGTARPGPTSVGLQDVGAATPSVPEELTAGTPEIQRSREKIKAEVRAQLLGPENDVSEGDPATEPQSVEVTEPIDSGSRGPGSCTTSGTTLQETGPDAESARVAEKPATAADLQALREEMVRLIDEKVEEALQNINRDVTGGEVPEAEKAGNTAEDSVAAQRDQPKAAPSQPAAATVRTSAAPIPFSDLNLKPGRTSLAESWSELLSSPLGKAALSASELRIGRSLPSATRAPALGVGTRASPRLSPSAVHVTTMRTSSSLGRILEPTVSSSSRGKSASHQMDDLFKKISGRVQALGGTQVDTRAQEHEDRMRSLSRSIHDLSMRMKFEPPP